MLGEWLPWWRRFFDAVQDMSSAIERCRLAAGALAGALELTFASSH